MVCAASGDHRSAKALLADSVTRYGAMEEAHVLAAEAKLGLAAAEIRY